MAWFHHALQDASLPQSPSMKNHTTNNHACLDSNPRSTIQVALSEGQDCPQIVQSSITSYPTAPQEMVCPRVGEHCSLNQSDGPVLLSYVTLQEQRCVVNWFLGWGPSQRECFLQDLISKAVPGKVCSLLEHLNKLQVTSYHKSCSLIFLFISVSFGCHFKWSCKHFKIKYEKCF